MTKEFDLEGKPLTGNDRFEGFCADVASQIADIVDFDYKIVPVKDGKYGGINEDGTWNGMVGELIRGVSWTLAIPVPTLFAHSFTCIQHIIPDGLSKHLFCCKKDRKEKKIFISQLYCLLLAWTRHVDLDFVTEIHFCCEKDLFLSDLIGSCTKRVYMCAAGIWGHNNCNLAGPSVAFVCSKPSRAGGRQIFLRALVQKHTDK